METTKTKTITLMIDNIKVEIEEGKTVLEAAKQIGINIPTLCFLKDTNEVGACRVCVVEIEGARNLQASCVLKATEGMVINTKSKKVRDSRKSTMELILSTHNRECLTCFRNKSCELQNLAEELNIKDVPYEDSNQTYTYDNKSHSIIRDQSKCILCGRCVNACKKHQGAGILEFTGRGINTRVAPAFDKSMLDSPCLYCGNCIISCPVGALREKEDIDRVWDAIENPDIHVICQTAPAVRSALGESFGLPFGTRVTGKMVAALKRMGFDKVYDTNFGADLTIMEEGHEFLDRFQNGGVLPMITSCSPGWVRYCEYYYPEFIPNLSSCKSPHQMLGAMAKSYYAERNGIDPSKIFVVSVMPCTSKKTEAARPELEVDGLRDVDCVITTRELAKMIKQARMDFNLLPDEQFDTDLLGEYSGAGAIFGATGGVMEAAMRTVADILENKDLEDFEYKEIRGIKDVKEATLNLGGKTIRIAVVHGTAVAGKFLDMIKNGEAEYDFIEIMGCSGGCVTGGGQPHLTAKQMMEVDIRKERAKALYEEDESRKYRKSHQNPQIQALYKDYLEEPNSHKAHKLLHTHYNEREKFPIR
ncbi:MAG: NADH-dependent [FeFe] hydrogenase, group A6 [Defluviitaleaceae bacterium]|nr:NADH-dependent [FeFe] hydrogenase, group A6 [Defluviitaleaceae bacterium]